MSHEASGDCKNFHNIFEICCESLLSKLSQIIAKTTHCIGVSFGRKVFTVQLVGSGTLTVLLKVSIEDIFTLISNVPLGQNLMVWQKLFLLLNIKLSIRACLKQCHSLWSLFFLCLSRLSFSLTATAACCQWLEQAAEIFFLQTLLDLQTSYCWLLLL